MKQCAVIIFLAIVIGGLLVLWYIKRQEPPVSPDTVGQYSKPSEVEKHKEGKDSNELPVKADRGVKKVSFEIADTVGVNDSVGTVKTHKVEVVIPNTPDPPVVSVDEKPVANVKLDVWVAPTFELRPNIMGGVSINRYTEPSLWAGMSFLTLFSKVHIGTGIDRFGVGVFGGYEIWREWNVGLQYHLWQMHDRPANASLFFAYRI